jgi:hypothetical protein
VAEATRVFRVTHRFHPLTGQEFELLAARQAWGESRIFFYDHTARLRAPPISWTSHAAPDPFIIAAAGQALCRIKDLLALVALLHSFDETRAGEQDE